MAVCVDYQQNSSVVFHHNIYGRRRVANSAQGSTHLLEVYFNEHELRDWLKKQHNWEFVRSDGWMFVLFVGWKLNNFKATGRNERFTRSS
jgi:hypothetical protein